MSIIYEALKKLQTSGSKKPSPKRISLFIYIIMVILGILLAKPILTFFTKPKKITPPSFPISSLPSEIPLKIKKEEITPIEEKKLPKEIPSFSLTGILYSDTERWVMINNRILREGDTIEGAEVIQISDSGVELNFEGEKIFLKLK